ncbi:MAG: exosome complex RNA-binding protein Csl4 [Candidatus Baldrarchaeia archaeon]
MCPEVNTGDFVVPGERLGTIEEFLPGIGTYEENGYIYASTYGMVLIDKVKKTISVISPVVHYNLIPKPGSMVIGKVTQIQNQLVFIDILKVNGRRLNTPFTGVIHVSMIDKNYTKTPFDAYKPGDIVRARVVNSRTIPLQLTTVGSHFGTILAYCSLCGTRLERLRRGLVCPKCGNKEKRKLASDYGMALNTASARGE